MRNICYKVVRNDYSSLVAGSKYRLIYEIGKVVRALKGTLGIFCFVTKMNASDFIYRLCFDNCRILTVKANRIDKIEIPNLAISGAQSEQGLDLFYLNKQTLRTCPPTGTICFRKVRVIGE